MATNCICTDKRACQVREARGLAPFCLMPAPAPMPRGDFDTYEAADAARKPGQCVVGVRGGMGHGYTRYIIRGKAA